MTEQPLFLEDESNGVLTLTLNRADVHNALNRPLLDALSIKLEEIAPRRDVRCVIITGSGEKAFCAGADLKERKGFTLEQTRGFVRKIRGVMDQIERLPMPTIAALDGVTKGPMPGRSNVKLVGAKSPPTLVQNCDG